MGQKESRGFRDFLEEEGVDLSPEFRPKRRISLRDSVRRLREMNLGFAVFAAALLAAGAAVWKLERPERPERPERASARKSPAVELVFDCSEPAARSVRAERKHTPVASRARGTPPEPEPVYHTVRPGDTLIGIASKYYGRGWKWTEIARANPQAAADSWKLKVGAKLLVPPLDE